MPSQFRRRSAYPLLAVAAAIVGFCALSGPANSASHVSRSSAVAEFKKPVSQALASSDLNSTEGTQIALPNAVDSRTAVYDISARSVILPDGRKLEAHSGIGKFMDDPSSVKEKNRGATPPNVYDISLREQPFHGVKALRLTPAAETAMYGRDGILAHTYMLGPTGQSNGCVVFRDYPVFLQAFLSGEISRLVVVPSMPSATAGLPSGIRVAARGGTRIASR